MRKTLFFLVIAFIFLANNLLAQDGHVAMVKNVSGQVTVLRSPEQLSVTPGMLLFENDKITSLASSSAGIIFTDGTLLSLGSSSEIDINQYLFEPKNNLYDFNLYMKKGTALYSTGKLGKLSPESVKIKTPRAMVGVRGTRFIVKVD